MERIDRKKNHQPPDSEYLLVCVFIVLVELILNVFLQLFNWLLSFRCVLTVSLAIRTISAMETASCCFGVATVFVFIDSTAFTRSERSAHMLHQPRSMIQMDPTSYGNPRMNCSSVAYYQSKSHTRRMRHRNL